MGSAYGPDLVPFALTQAGAQKFLDRPTDTLKINLTDADPTLSGASYDLASGQYRQVALNPAMSSMPTIGGACTATTPADLRSYWWCQGAADRIQIGTLLRHRTGLVESSLKTPLGKGLTDRPIVTLPICADATLPDGSVGCDVRGFLALRLISQSGDTLRAALVSNAVVPGTITGRGNGVDTKTYAVNLVR